MMCMINKWLCTFFVRGPLRFELSVLDAVASRLTDGLKEAFLEQVGQIASVQVDPFKTCFVLIMRKKEHIQRIETSKGVILARVIGTLGGLPLKAELGLCNGVLYAIVVNRRLERIDRKRECLEVADVHIFPQQAIPSAEWIPLLDHSDELARMQIEVLRTAERWLHPWDGAWYLCMADIGSQYYVLQRCDETGGLALLDYIDNEIVKEGCSPAELILYAYSNGEWIEDKTPDTLQALVGSAIGIRERQVSDVTTAIGRNEGRSLSML